MLASHAGDYAGAVHHLNAALKKRPAYSDAHYNLGNVLAAEGKYAEAADEYAAAIRSKPDLPDAHNNLGAMYVRLNRLGEAATEIRAALNLDPDFAEAHAQLGTLLLNTGDTAVARLHFEEAVRLRPNMVQPRIRLGLLQAQNGELDSAITQFQEAIKLDSNNVTAYYNLGAAYAAEKKLAAAEEFAHAARLDPNDAELQGRLAATLAVLGRSEEAIKAYQEALRLKPEWPVALRDLAWLLATNPKPTVRNGEEAVKLAEHANAILPKPDPRFLEALDAAYAEAGRFDDAIKTAEKVQQLATVAQEKSVADRAAQRIALYKAGKPYHE